MRVVVQRVSRAKVTVSGRIVGEIEQGLLVLLGIAKDDQISDADYLVEKLINLRIFDDGEGKMNLSLTDIDGEMLVVSQFTLYADTRRGRRPSFIEAARGEDAVEIYRHFVEKSQAVIRKVATGEFGAMMDVELVNDGPVTIVIDSE
ncbi:MAG: D-aminoacyl-tRNA deacylase [Pyrinomonadaceae bacterium]